LGVGVRSGFNIDPAAHLFVDVAQEQRGIVSVFHVWRAGRDARRRSSASPQIVDDPWLRKQTDQDTSTATSARRNPEDLLRSRCAADVVIFSNNSTLNPAPAR